MNVEQKIVALESLLEKVRTNAAKPRPSHGATIGTAAASRATDDVAGPAVAAPPVRVPPAVTPGSTKFGDDDWSDKTETFETPVPLAAPLPGPAKDAATKAPAIAATAKPGPAKPAPITSTTKPVEIATAKPPVTAPAKPLVTAPAIKPVVTTPAVKPLVTPTATKPTTPQAAPIPLTNKVAAPVIKTPAVPIASKLAEALKPTDTSNLNKTLTGVGDNAVKAPDIRASAIAEGISLPTTGTPPPVNAISLEVEKRPAPVKPEADRKPVLPSALVDSDGEEENEPTQLYYEPSAASRRATELAALNEKQLDEVKASLVVDKEPDIDRVEILSPETKTSADKIKVDAPKLDLPWVEKSERKIDPAKIGLPTPEDKLPKKAGPSQTELDLELIASQEGSLESVDLDVAEPKAETKPAAVVSEDKPAVDVGTPPISEKKPVVQTKPIAEKKPVVDEPVLEKPKTSSKGVPTLLIVAAVILMLAAGAFVAMQQGWIGGGKPTPVPTVAPPTNTTPTATQSAAPTAPATAQPPPTTDTAAPAVSASAAPADSAAAAPADSAAPAPADSAAAPPASAAAAPPAPPATAGAPSVDPATLNNNQGLIFVTSNKPARVYLTGKLAGDTNTELKTDCGLKFVRLADPAQDMSKPPIWLTAGQPQQIDCRKYTTFSLTVP